MSLLYYVQVFVAEDENNDAGNANNNNGTSSSFTSVALLYVASLISPTGFALAMDKILVRDIAGVGVNTANLWHGPGISVGGSIVMMLVDLVLYALLAFWLDSVVPGEHGTKRSPFFCLSWRFGQRERKRKSECRVGRAFLIHKYVCVGSFNHQILAQGFTHENIQTASYGVGAAKW